MDRRFVYEIANNSREISCNNMQIGPYSLTRLSRQCSDRGKNDEIAG